MKNILTYWAGVLAILLSSCIDEPIAELTTGLRITGGLTTDSRTAFIEDKDVIHTHWVAGDKIGLYTDSQTNLPYQAQSGGATTEFIKKGEELEKTDGEKVWAYYPYISVVNVKVPVLPNTRTLSSDKPVPVFLYSNASIKGNQLNFQFKHYFAYLRITVSAEMFRNFKNAHYLSDELNIEDCGIYISSSEPISSQGALLDWKTMEMTNNSSDCKRIIFNTKNLDLEGNNNYTFLIPVLPQSPTASIGISFFFRKYESDGLLHTSRLETKKLPQDGIQAGRVYQIDYTTENERHREILRKLYQTTGGDQWTNNENWMSDLSINEWYGVNRGDIDYPYVYSLQLFNNNLTGQLPAELAELMDNAYNISLGYNRLNGDIPETIRNHEKWSSLAWGIIHQDFWNGGGFNLTDSRIYTADKDITRLFSDETMSLKDIFARNKLTQVIRTYANADQIINNMDVARVNHHLDYQSKGLETIIFTDADEDSRNTIRPLYEGVNGMDWFSGYHESRSTIGYSYVYDSQGQLVHIAPFQNGKDNTKAREELDTFLRSILGDPVEHPEFSMDLYTSTDYSKDGEVYLIQQATEGKGIDIVLMGDGFTDQHMESGGHYESKMLEATEKFFSMEPYKSYRNRFNVYGVKVVSPNAEFTDNAQHAIQEENSVALSYAKLTGSECPLVAVIYNTESYVGRSHCTMYSDDSCVAYNMGEIDGTLLHELGGHGIAHLADEYVEAGNENLSLPASGIETLDNYSQRKWGYYTNVDYHATSSTVHWAHILSDSRFAAEELGVYEGAWLYGYGVYRPSESSIMRNSSLEYFNAPSREIIYKAVMMRSEGDEWLSTYNYEDFVKQDEAARTSYANSRSISTYVPDVDMHARHLPPTFIKGSWRDELKKAPVRIPLR